MKAWALVLVGGVAILSALLWPGQGGALLGARRVDAAESKGRNTWDELAVALESHGGWVNPKLESGMGAWGCSVYASEKIKAGEIITATPRGLSIWRQDLTHVPQELLETDERADEHWVIVYELAALRARNRTLTPQQRHPPMDAKQAYFNAIPADLDLPPFWETSDLDEFQGMARVRRTTRFLREEFDDTWAMWQERKSWTHVPPVKWDLTWDDVAWAHMAAGSRSWEQWILPPYDRTHRVLVPLADMFNHAHWAESDTCRKLGKCPKRSTKTYGLYYNGTHLLLESHHDTEPGEELFLNYGENPNNRMLSQFGFIEMDNPHDFYEWPLDPHRSVREKQHNRFKWRYVDKHGKRKLKVYRRGVDPESVLALRLLFLEPGHMTAYHMGRILQGFSIGGKSEAKVHRYIKHKCSTQLKKYPTTPEEDARILKDPDIGHRLWQAVTYRLEMKKVLTNCIRDSEAALDQL